MKLVEIKLYLISYIGKLGFEDTVFIEANSIGIDPEKSSSEEVYRTGQVVGVRNETPLIAHFSKYIHSLKDGTRFCFIDELAGKKIGLWN